jgi:hypothetical protein
MEAIVCQVAEAKAVEISVDAQAVADSITLLTSTEMSFVGGGLMAVCFA